MMMKPKSEICGTSVWAQLLKLEKKKRVLSTCESVLGVLVSIGATNDVEEEFYNLLLFPIPQIFLFSQP